MPDVPHVQEIPYTDPLAAFTPCAADPFAIFLDSSLTADHRGRYSFIAADPILTLTSQNGHIRLGGQTFTGDPFAVLREQLAQYPLAPLPDLPPFQTGVAGYFGYDLCHHLERLPAPRHDDRLFPDLSLGFYDVVMAFDHHQQRAWIFSSGYPEREAARTTRAQARTKYFQSRITRSHAPTPLRFASRAVVSNLLSPTSDLRPPAALPASNFTRPAYEAAVQRVIDYIYAGDIYQANLSQRLQAALPDGDSPFALYQRLRRLNPAPCAAYLNFGEVVIASASPERFLQLREGWVETRPIKGTRPRGATPAEDDALARELLASEKDRAENVMIVDLLRNDLSRVCRDHSVTVPELCALESYATVHHLVSTVVGQLNPGASAVDLLRAAFPGGSVTGAPKIRAMEMIAELEPTRRGPYCGSVGYISFAGEMDTSITIRTYAIKNNLVTFQVGGGIVADSDPAMEYEETLTKAKALLAALEPQTSEVLETSEVLPEGWDTDREAH